MNTADARRQMVEQQVRTWNVDDASILATLGELSRDEFAPPRFAHLAYADTEVPLAHGQFMLRPTIEGKILQMLDLGPDDNVLEIGTGTGYLTACLTQLAGSVTSVDIYEDFVATAQRNLAAVDIDDVDVRCMDALSALPDGEFDAVLVSGSTPRLHLPFVDALKPTGRLFAVVGDAPVQHACLIRPNIEKGWQIESSFETLLPTLVNAPQTPAFSF